MVRGACGRCRTRPVPIPNEEIGMGCKSVFRRCCEIKGRTPFGRMGTGGASVGKAPFGRMAFPGDGEEKSPGSGSTGCRGEHRARGLAFGERELQKSPAGKSQKP
jgi:hypothetical protein